MSDGTVQREVKILQALEKIESHLSTLVDLAMASGLVASTERTETREEREKARKERDVVDSRFKDSPVSHRVTQTQTQTMGDDES